MRVTSRGLEQVRRNDTHCKLSYLSVTHSDVRLTCVLLAQWYEGTGW